MNRTSSSHFVLLAATAVAIMAAALLLLAFLERDRSERIMAPEASRPASVCASGAEHGPLPASAPEPGAEPKDTEPPAQKVTTVRGRVTGPDGFPVPRHRVMLALPPTDGAPLAHVKALFTLAENPQAHSWPIAESSPDGLFEFCVERKGKAMILAGPPEYKEYSAEIALSGGLLDVEVLLRSGLSVSGQVLEKSTGAPVGGVVVTLIQPGSPGATIRRQVTSEDGRFIACGFAEGEVKINADPAGGSWIDPGWERTTWVKAGDAEVVVPVFLAGMVSFRAAAGTPETLYGGAIRAIVSSAPEAAALVQMEVDGGYTLRGPAGTHTYALWPHGFAPVKASFTIEAQARRQHGSAVVFPAGAMLTGTLEIPEEPGAGIPRSAAIYVECVDPNLERVLMREIRLDGRNFCDFAFEELPRGLHRVVAFARGFGIFQATVAVAVDGARLRIVLPRAGADPQSNGKPAHERNSLVMDLSLPDLEDFEVVPLLAAVSGTALRFDGPAGASRTRDIRMSNTRFPDAVRGVKNAWKLDFDPSTGTFKRR